MTDKKQRTKERIRFSQETIAIVSVGVALAGLHLVTTGELRDLRNEWEEESRQLRSEARVDRESFQREILPARNPATQARTAGYLARMRPSK